MFYQTEEDVSARSNWIGCWRLQSEVRESLTSDGIILVIQDGGNLCDMFKLLNRGVCGEEIVPNEKHKL